MEREFYAAADYRFYCITINFKPEKLEDIDEEMCLRGVLVHELTHIMQFGGSGAHSIVETSGEHGYLKACSQGGIFGGHLHAFFAFLVPLEVEAMIYQGIYMRSDFYGESTAMEGLEAILNFYFLEEEVAERTFARENAILNIIPKNPRLRAIFMGDPVYLLEWNALSKKTQQYARTARRFVHAQNIVKTLDKGSLVRMVESFRRMYGREMNPKVFEKTRARCRKENNFLKCGLNRPGTIPANPPVKKI